MLWRLMVHRTRIPYLAQASSPGRSGHRVVTVIACWRISPVSHWADRRSPGSTSGLSVRPAARFTSPWRTRAAVRFEQAAPVRATTGRHIGYESWLERDHLMRLDHDPSSPGSPPSRSGCSGRTATSAALTRSTTFARRDDGSSVVIDCRRANQINPATQRPSHSAIFIQRFRHDSEIPKSAAICVLRASLLRATAITSRRNCAGNGLGTTGILPARTKILAGQESTEGGADPSDMACAGRAPLDERERLKRGLLSSKA
jgi:hypothetical protein